MQNNKPSNLDAEASVIGSVMMNNELWHSVSDKLTAGDFYLTANQAMFRAIEALMDTEQPCDAVTVAERLEAVGELESVGGMGAVVDMAQNAIGYGNVEFYAQIVKNKSKQRELIAAGTEIVTAAYGAGDVTDMIETAQQKVMAVGDDKTYEAKTIGEVLPAWLEELDRKFHAGVEFDGIRWGFNNLDQQAGALGKGNLIILAARPAMGKTALALNLATYAAKHHGHVLFFSLEMPRHELINRVMSAESGVLQDLILKPKQMEDPDWNRLQTTMRQVMNYPITIDDRGGLKLAEIKATARRQHRKTPLSMIVIDYLQLVQGERQKGDSKSVEVGSISNACKALAKELGLPIVLLSQLNRSVDGRQDKRPVMSDLRDSGEIEQDADKIAFIYRDVVYNPNSSDADYAEIIIIKNRNGRTGRVPLRFEGHLSRFVNEQHEFAEPKKEQPLGAY